MSLNEQIDNRYLEAAKAKDLATIGILRMIKAAITNRKIESGAAKDQPLPDPELVAVLRSELKKRVESATSYRDNDRAELAEQEEREAELIKTFLPEPLSEAEIVAAVDDAIASGASGFGAIMGAAMAKLKDRADGQQVSAIVKAKLANK